MSEMYCISEHPENLLIFAIFNFENQPFGEERKTSGFMSEIDKVISEHPENAHIFASPRITKITKRGFSGWKIRDFP